MNALVTADVHAPSISYHLVAPMLIVLGAAMVGVLVEAFAPRRSRYVVQVAVTLVGLVAAFVAVILATDHKKATTAAGAVVIDGPALFLQGTILVLAILAVLTMAERFAGNEGDAFTSQAASVPGSAYEAATARAGWVQTEVFPLALFSIAGMMLFPASNDLLTLFVALEVLSLPLYLLCGLARRRRLLSQEAALKYFLLGAFSSAFFLFGAAMLFGFSSSLYLSDISTAISNRGDADPMMFIGIAMVSIGLLFKVGAVPFHMWTPDVYQGAPTPVTGFMAACTKVAAFGAMLRVFYVALAPARWDWQPILWVVAILTMLVGSVLAITQTDIKRMLAYSSIAHAGFILVGVLAFDRSGLSGSMFYLAAYGFTTIGAFAVVTLVRDSAGEATHLSQWAGLARRSPVLAAVFTLFLLAFAGIPLTSGFTGKFAVFSAAVANGGTWLAVVGVVSSAIAAFFYVRIIVLMYFSDPDVEGTVVAVPSILTTVAISVGVLMTLLLGVLPGPLLDLASRSALFLP
ncbi:NADH-quinone oxidoreductase subunit NuoN [Angustibacter sp. McL0619]|uniref:NADH-quinone oxidoreductase subunit NuoN n=1 Tax=Angustibacter sp. McL0619 TaxID=3415676 RepID=UPI003CF58F69